MFPQERHHTSVALLPVRTALALTTPHRHLHPRCADVAGRMRYDTLRAQVCAQVHITPTPTPHRHLVFHTTRHLVRPRLHQHPVHAARALVQDECAGVRIRGEACT